MSKSKEINDELDIAKALAAKGIAFVCVPYLDQKERELLQAVTVTRLTTLLTKAPTK